ncbi:MAG: ABC transporter ATP-binding protein [Oscillospiraceae bacterium]|jgi:simple sugar transport system ATP-binding protein|nr:ABC transporter ATP-binding protein [Oscillospiraceae bacterium]
MTTGSAADANGLPTESVRHFPEGSASPALELKRLTKTFGSLTACDAIDITLYRGEILTLLGENGSGKTTLMNMITGLYRPDSGAMFVRGKREDIRTPSDARRLGIGMIHQHFKLVEPFTAQENILLGLPRSRGQSPARLRADIGALSGRYGLGVELDRRVSGMSVSQKQTVEILKVLYRGADVLILDEPTAVLTPQEADRLFGILRRMRDNGAAIIMITHKLSEVMALSDRVAVLRQGRRAATVRKDETTPEQLTEFMVGQKVTLNIERPATVRKPLLSVKNLTVRDADGATRLSGVSFGLESGEILGVAGVAGSGQKQLCEAIAGLVPTVSGEILLHGRDIAGQSPRKIYDQGVRLGFIPEDRLGMGLVGSMNIVDNLLLRDYRLQRGPFVRRSGAAKRAGDLVRRLSIIPPEPLRPVSRLSGGNLQKVLLGRELMGRPELLVTSYVVRGLDVHSSYVIYDLLNEQKKNGVGALFVGEDLDVLLELCDRIMVLCGGRVTGIVDSKAATRERIGLLMAGGEV